MTNNEEIPELGEVAYVGYFKASGGKSLISGAPLPAWDEQAPQIRQAWNLGAMAVVDVWREADAEPKPASVIVVTDHAGRERRYAASGFGHHADGTLGIGESGDGETLAAVAEYSVNAWASVHKEGSLVPDGTRRKLAIAVKGLNQLADHVDDTGNREWADVRLMIGDILDDIAEQDL